MDGEEFARWEDLDLDFLLGEYTEDDLVSEVEEGSDFVIEDETVLSECQQNGTADSKKSKEKKKNKIKTLFSCPLCPKQYASISGFRGHVIRKHDRGDIRAQDNLLRANGSAGETKDGCEEIETPVDKKTITGDQWEGFIKRAISHSIDDIQKCPKNRSAKSKHGKELISVAKSVTSENMTQHLASPLAAVLTTLSDGNFSSAALEKAWVKFHQIKTDARLCETLCAEIPSESIVGRRFVQALLPRTFKLAVDFAKEFLTETNNVRTDEPTVTDNDQSVLYYVAGYMARKCHKIMPEANFTTKNLPSNFLKQPSQWVEKVTRGGLLIPNDNFYLLIREFELVMRKSYDPKKLHSSSLCKAVMVENILKAFMVRHYWKSLGDFPETSLEYAAKLFLTVRGFALTRQYRNERTAALKVKALRKSLKKKSSAQ